ncbi:MAG: 50S ribosomal protein L18 [Bacteroidota bacterium]
MGITKKVARRRKIKAGIRKRVRGTNERPRLTVFRSNKEIYAQIINDDTQATLVDASTKTKDIADQVASVNKTEASRAVGRELARRAKDAGIEKVVFDRNGFNYHGRVKALAEGAREGGLNF